MEKAGYLIKLGGRVKNWKKRWFVMMDGKLCYFKTKVSSALLVYFPFVLNSHQHWEKGVCLSLPAVDGISNVFCI